MAESYFKLYQGTLTTSAAVLYTPTSTYSAIVKSIRVVNITSPAASATVTLYQTASNGSAGTGNMILPATTIDGGGFGEFDGTMTLTGTDSIWGKSDTASALTVTIYGVEVN